MRYFFFVLVAALGLWYASAADCPPEDQIKPCTCEDFLGLVQCGNITDMQTLVDVFSRTGDRKFKFFALFDSSVMYLPANAISTKGFDNLVISSVIMSALFDSTPIESNEITMLIIENVTFQRGIGWELFSTMKKLALINVENSEIKSIDKAFTDNINRGITNIIMKNTKTKKIQQDAFAQLTKLFTLEISNSEISALQRSMFASPSALQEINFSGNKIVSLPDDIFSNSPVLKVLHLENNLLTTVKEAVFRDSYSRSGWIYLDGNPTVCDCSILWFVSEEKRLILGKCASPDEQKGKSLADLKKSDLSYC